MRKLLIGFFLLLSTIVYSQPGSLSQSVYRSRVNDSTSVTTPAGYGLLFYNNQRTTPAWIFSNDQGATWHDLGSGTGGGGTWGSITGTLSDQTDLQGALNAKLPLTFTGNQTIATGGFWLRLQGTGTQIPTLALDAPNNIRKAIEFRTGNVARWQIHTENNETGSGNTGTDFHIERYNDVGAQIDAPFSIGRTDGVAWFLHTPIHDGTIAAGNSSNAIPTTEWVQGEITPKVNAANTATALTDGASITITGTKHTLTTDEATITFSQSYTGDFSNIDVTFNTTSSTWTFPAGSLCSFNGLASGNNTATISGVSGDKIVISIWFVSSGNYRIAIKNFGQ